MTIKIKVNGADHEVDVDGHMPLLVGAARRARHDRHQVRLRHGAMRRMHRASRRPSDPLLHHARSQRRRQRRSRRSKRSERRQRRKDPTGVARSSKSCNAAIASRARSCRPRPCSRATQIRPTPTSTRPCRAISAAAAPIRAFAPPSNKHRNPLEAEVTGQCSNGSTTTRLRAEGSFAPHISCHWRRRRRWVAARRLSPSVDRRDGASCRGDLRAQRLRAHQARRQHHAHHAAGRDGPGHLHLDVDADRRGARGRSRQNGPRGRAPERQALCQSPARLPGHRRLDIGAGVLGAAASRGRDRSRHADRGGGGSVECRSGLMPRRKGRGGLPDRANGSITELWSTRRRSCRCRTRSRSRIPRTSP